jgi:putative protease
MWQSVSLIIDITSRVEMQSMKPELLAPVGDVDSMHAAVCNGADAVYLGVGQFNARQRAINPRPDELDGIVSYLHDHNVKAYVAFNTLIFSDELGEACQYITAIAQSGADAVIVQDLGLATLVHQQAGTLKIHASTQMSLSEPLGIEFVQQLGISRVILARELSIDQIGTIAGQAGTMELEVFVHGAICMSFSGQCLASQCQWSRSANRGLCGQACRLPYKLIVDGQPYQAKGDFILSTKDLSSYDLVGRLIQATYSPATTTAETAPDFAGLAGMKIEGRLKSAHYVAAAVQVYRTAIDQAGDGKDVELSAQQLSNLQQTFSRGFSHGFLDGLGNGDEQGLGQQELVHGQSPKSIGVPAGKVIGRSRRGIIVQLASTDISLKAGDGLVFDAQFEGEPIGGRIYSAVDFIAHGDGTRLELTFDYDLDLSDIPLECKIWKTDDPQMDKQLEQSFARDVVANPAPLSVSLLGQAGLPLEITFRDDAGRSVTVKSDQPMQLAQKHPMTIQLANEQLGRLGGTPFRLASVELVGPAGPCEQLDVMIPKSILNSLRRDGVEKLVAMRHKLARHEITNPNALETLRASIAPIQPIKAVIASEAMLTVLVRTLDQIDALAQLDAGDRPGMVYGEFPQLEQYAQACQRASRLGLPFGIVTPRVLLPGDENLLGQLAELARQSGAQSILARNLGCLSYFRRQCPDIQIIADASLNVANEISANCLRQAGCARITPAYEVDASKLLALAGRIEPSILEAVVYQHVPMMHTVHCLFAANLSGGINCQDCARPCLEHKLALRDRNDVDHPVCVDICGRNTIYKSALESRFDAIGRFMQAGLPSFRVELLDESAQQTIQACRLAKAAM